MEAKKQEEYTEVEFKSHDEYCDFLKKEGIRFGPFYESKTTHETELTKALRGAEQPIQIMVNNLYQVSIFDATHPKGDWPDMWHLSIKRLDREPVKDWRDMQLIKNSIIGPEHEGIELYPAEMRLVDTSNQYHMFVLKDKTAYFPFGFADRMIDDGSACGTKQRLWPEGERPSDCSRLTDNELIKKAKELKE